MTVDTSYSENYYRNISDEELSEEGEILESNKSYYILYLTNSDIETFILFDDNRFTLYGSKRNDNDDEYTNFYAEYFLCQIELLVTFLSFMYNRFDADYLPNVALYTVVLDKYSLSDYGFDYIYNKCGNNECLNNYSSASYRMNIKKLFNLLEMIQQ
jgi:hypothetical protein